MPAPQQGNERQPTPIKDLLNTLKTVKDWMKVGDALYGLKRYEEALAAFEQVIRLDPNYANAYDYKGEALRKLERYEEAITAYDQVIRLDPDYVQAYFGKSDALHNKK